jgi:hypothetical protein
MVLGSLPSAPCRVGVIVADTELMFFSTSGNCDLSSMSGAIVIWCEWLGQRSGWWFEDGQCRQLHATRPAWLHCVPHQSVCSNLSQGDRL